MRFRTTVVAVEEHKVSHIVTMCLVALGIQHEMRMRHILICELSDSTTFLHKFCPKNVSFQEDIREIWYKMYTGLHVKYSLLSDFNETWIFPKEFRKILKYQI
jgi:hypothetical protein